MRILAGCYILKREEVCRQKRTTIPKELGERKKKYREEPRVKEAQEESLKREVSKKNRDAEEKKGRGSSKQRRSNKNTEESLKSYWELPSGSSSEEFSKKKKFPGERCKTEEEFVERVVSLFFKSETEENSVFFARLLTVQLSLVVGFLCEIVNRAALSRRRFIISSEQVVKVLAKYPWENLLSNKDGPLGTVSKRLRNN